eukprot:g10409.t1
MLLQKQQARHEKVAYHHARRQTCMADFIRPYTMRPLPIYCQVYPTSFDRWVSGDIQMPNYVYSSSIASEMLRAFRQQPNHDLALVDVGNIIGFFTTLMGFVGASAIGFEPGAFLSGINVTQQGTFYQAKGNVGDSRCVPEGMDFELSKDSHTKGSTVQMVLLDEVLPALLKPGQQVSVLKLGCQGCEAQALRGASALLKRGLFRVIIFEHDAKSWEKFGKLHAQLSYFCGSMAMISIIIVIKGVQIHQKSSSPRRLVP